MTDDADSPGRSGRTRAPLRAAGRSIGAALSRLLTGGLARRRAPSSAGQQRRWGRRAGPVASVTSAFLPDDDSGLDLHDRIDDSLGAHEPSAMARAGFPMLLSRNGRPQGLVTVGHKQWGNWWDGRGLLKVRIYDFAVYADSEQVQGVASRAPVSPSTGLTSLHHRGLRILRGRGGGGAASRGEAVNGGVLFQDVNASHQVEMSLQLRAARSLPVWALAQEFDGALTRRSAKVGGSGDDPAIRELLKCFSSLRIPATALAPGGDAVRRGSVITFERSAGGRLRALADGVTLGEVQSPKLCEALFDLYLGDPPVSRQARAAGEDTLARMSRGIGELYRPEGRQHVACPRSGGGGGGLGDLEGCMLMLEEQ